MRKIEIQTVPMGTWIQNIETNENEGEDRRTKKKRKREWSLSRTIHGNLPQISN